MIDMEEGVVNEILKGPLRDVFDCQQLITDVSGSGNNWYIYCPMFVHAYDPLVLINNVSIVNRAVIKDFKVLGICNVYYPVSKANNHMVSSLFK